MCVRHGPGASSDGSLDFSGHGNDARWLATLAIPEAADIGE